MVLSRMVALLQATHSTCGNKALSSSFCVLTQKRLLGYDPNMSLGGRVEWGLGRGPCGQASLVSGVRTGPSNPSCLDLYQPCNLAGFTQGQPGRPSLEDFALWWATGGIEGWEQDGGGGAGDRNAAV